MADGSLEFSVATEHKVRTELKADTFATLLFRWFRLKRNGWGELVASPLDREIGDADLPFVDLGADS